MLGATRRVQVHVFDAPVDMRRSFDELHALVTNQMGANALSGDLFLFVSKNRRRAKVLYWDVTGLCVFALDKPDQQCLSAVALLKKFPANSMSQKKSM